MMKYPKDYLEEIKLRVKVSQIVGKFVQLKKRGKEFIGLSPFKNEKTPSFTVSDEKGFYHCFSTGEHGNIFDFLMKTKSIGFGEAVKILASEAGMQPYRFSNFDEKREKRFKTYKSILKDYSDFFLNELFKTENITALDYLKKRNLSEKTIREFKLGFVPWKNDFYKALLNKYTADDIGLTGLYYKNEKTGKFIDRFNSRIIFPINNLVGEPIAFGGRIIKKDTKVAKYINSPETEFYKKGRTIFNLDNAKSCRPETSEVIIVEGYMDVISLHSSGIKNVVSNSGIAITESQIELIWKFFSDPIICLDGDESGQKAALRAAERLIPLINENNKIYFSILPKGEDPDDYIKKYGKEKFIKFLKLKKIIQFYIWDLYLEEIDKNDPFAISKFEKKIKNLCYSIKDETLKKYILEIFLEKIKSLTPIQNKKVNFKKNFWKNIKILSETKNLHKQKDHLTKEQLKEYSALFMMINFPHVIESKKDDLIQLEFSLKENEELKKEIISKFSENKDLNETKTEIKEKHSKHYDIIEKNSNIKNIMYKKEENEKKYFFEELLEDLKEMNHLKKIEFLESKITENLDESSYSELIKLKNQLNRE